MICSRDDIAARIEKETRQKMDLMHKSVSGAKDRIINDLLTRVVWEVNPKLHSNLRVDDWNQ